MAETANQILNRHLYLDDNTFWIPRKASIRDQIRMADVFVRAAKDEKIFELKPRHLVLGGGVTGVAVAIKAAALGTQIVLIEKAEQLFDVQARCSSRYIHPYEYSWPVIPFWPADEQGLFDSYPMLKEDREVCPHPLRWTAGPASEVARKWQNQIADETSLKPVFRPDAPLLKGRSLRQLFDSHDDFGLIIACVGGEERRAVAKDEEKEAFGSFTYWSRDKFESDNLPLELGRDPLKILISGGGDGGLQDFLRLTTRPQGGNLFSAGALLRKLVDQLAKHDAFQESVKRVVQENPKDPTRPDPKKLWKEHADLAVTLISDHELCQKLKPLLDPLILSRNKQVTLAFDAETFSPCYALNSFLVHLIVRYIDEKGAPVSAPSEATLRPNTTIKLKGIKSAQENHVCKKVAEECLNASHKVEFEAGAEGTYDVIILRHGAEQLGQPRSPDGPVSGG